jgi:hypothetical protein
LLMSASLEAVPARALRSVAKSRIDPMTSASGDAYYGFARVFPRDDASTTT